MSPGRLGGNDGTGWHRGLSIAVDDASYESCNTNTATMLAKHSRTEACFGDAASIAIAQRDHRGSGMGGFLGAIYSEFALLSLLFCCLSCSC